MMAQPYSVEVAQRISKSLFLISSGGNDVIAFFAATKLPNNTAVSLFFNTIITKYENHIKALYGMAARKFAVINLGLIGCVPSARVLSPTGGCNNGMNQLVKGLDDEIAALLKRLSVALPGLQYSIGNAYELFTTTISKPQSFGFEEVKNACCGSGKLNAQGHCTPNATYCVNRHRYLFWDRTHTTQRASEISGSVFYNGPAQLPSNN